MKLKVYVLVLQHNRCPQEAYNDLSKSFVFCAKKNNNKKNLHKLSAFLDIDRSPSEPITQVKKCNKSVRTVFTTI